MIVVGLSDNLPGLLGESHSLMSGLSHPHAPSDVNGIRQFTND